MITINIFLMLKVLGLGYVISEFVPLGWVIDLLPDNLLKYSLHILTGCWKCVSFWMSLIWIQNIWFSCFVYFIVKSIQNDDKFKYYTGRIKEDILNWFKAWRIKRDHKQMEKIIERLKEKQK